MHAYILHYKEGKAFASRYITIHYSTIVTRTAMYKRITYNRSLYTRHDKTNQDLILKILDQLGQTLAVKPFLSILSGKDNFLHFVYGETFVS